MASNTKKKIEIIYDIDGKAIDVAIDKTLNLTQQAKALTSELRKTSDPEAFKILSNRLGDVNDGLAKTNAKSKDLFASLSMLPGPVGDFFGQLSGSIDLLKTFSSFSLKDLKFQLGETAGDIADIGKNLLETTAAQEANVVVTEAEAAATAELAAAEAAATVSTEAHVVVVEAETVATEAAEVATIGLGAALKAIGIGLIIAGLAVLVTYWDKISDALTGATDKTRAYDEAQKQVNKDVKDFNIKLFEVKGALAAAKAGTISKKDALKEYNDKLGKTIGYAGSLKQAEELMAANTGVIVESIKLRAQAQIFYGKSAEASAKLVSGEGLAPDFWDQAYNSIMNVGNPLGMLSDNLKDLSNNIETTQKNATAFAAEGDKLTNAAIENDKKLKKGLAEPPKEGGTKKEFQDKDLIKKAQEVQDSLTEITTNGEKERTRAEIINAGEREAKEVEAMVVSEKYKTKQAEVAAQIRATAQAKALESDTKFDDDKKKKDEEFENQVADAAVRLTDIEIAAMEEGTAKLKATREQKYTADKKALDKLLADKLISEKDYQIAVINLNQGLVNDLTKIDVDAAKDAYTKRQERYDEELKTLQIKGEALTQGTMAYYDNRRAILDKALQKELDAIKQKAAEELWTEEKKNNAINAAKEKAAKARGNIDMEELKKYMEYGLQIAAAAQNIFGEINERNKKDEEAELKRAEGNAEEQDKIKRKYFEKNKKNQIAQAWIATFQAAIQAFQSLAGIPVVGPALGAIAAGAAIYFGTKKVNDIKATTYEGSAGASGGAAAAAAVPAPPNLGKNYGSGGMINGPRHAAGGVAINAEGGEAVMTRGAVTMFAPLLSMMNQAGGGTSFSSGAMGRPNTDNARTSDASNQNPMIVKTYVVSNDLTTEAQKQARLKDLSTL